MTHRVLVFILFVLPQVRCWPFSMEAHGSRGWFRIPDDMVKFDPNTTRLYTHGAVIGEVLYNDTEKVAQCRFTEFRSETERDYLYEKLGRQPEEVDFKKMTAVIAECGTTVASTRAYPRFSNPLFPGTLWCGPGDAAMDYLSLGVCSEPDACCRDHDLCPKRALSGQVMTPLGLNRVTISDCRCDLALKNCLQRSARTHHSLASRVLVVLFGMGIGHCLADNGTVVPINFKILDLMQ